MVGRRGRPRVWAKVVVVVGLAAGFELALAPASGAATPDPTYYVALGGSASVGFQPTRDKPRGAETDSGYANDLFARERARWPTLELVHLGCPGTTTETMLDGAGHCHDAEGSQMADALDFLHSHRSTVLMTVDLGFNDVSRCLHHEEVDAACVDGALAAVHDQLTRIAAELRAAGGSRMQIIGLGHFDPYLGDERLGPRGAAFAAASLPVIARLNDTMRSAYAGAAIPMADVASAFEMTDDEATAWGTGPDLARNVARVCMFTWMCAPAPQGPNAHPNDAGYQAISNAIAQVVDRH
ncbi:MAG: SGNH/GDSL hydrolase family protein [Acidimicrobiales bacterium]